MEEILTEKLYKYIGRNNPDLLQLLQTENRVAEYLIDTLSAIAVMLQQWQAEGKPTYIVEELCMSAMTENLRPSMYNYLINILEDEFAIEYEQMLNNGILQFEVINLIQICNPVFEKLGFTTENEDDKQLYYAITGSISNYLAGNK